jgi:hypothetical protein
MVAVPLGGLLGGYVVQYAGLTVGMAAVSTIYLLTTLSPLVLPAFRQWDSAGPAAGSGPDVSTAASASPSAEPTAPTGRRSVSSPEST